MFNQDHGVYVGDMFGSLADSPLLRMAREEQYNRANAEEELKRRAEVERADNVANAFRSRANQGLWGSPQESEIAAPDVEAAQREVFGKWGLMAPGERDWSARGHGTDNLRTVNGSLMERDPWTGEWTVAATAPMRPGRPSDRVQDIAGWRALLKEAELESDPVRKAQILEAAATLKAELDKLGKFAPLPPAKPATQSDSTSVNWFTNPAARFDTNAPPLIPRTNFSSRVTGPLGTNSLGAFGQGLSLGGFGGGTNAPASSSRPASKASLANQLAAAHPDWSREQIISEVNRTFR